MQAMKQDTRCSGSLFKRCLIVKPFEYLGMFTTMDMIMMTSSSRSCATGAFHRPLLLVLTAVLVSVDKRSQVLPVAENDAETQLASSLMSPRWAIPHILTALITRSKLIPG
jgi:hypothetical protein